MLKSMSSKSQICGAGRRSSVSGPIVEVPALWRSPHLLQLPHQHRVSHEGLKSEFLNLVFWVYWTLTAITSPHEYEELQFDLPSVVFSVYGTVSPDIPSGQVLAAYRSPCPGPQNLKACPQIPPLNPPAQKTWRTVVPKSHPQAPTAPQPHVPMSNPNGVELFWVGDLSERCPVATLSQKCCLWWPKWVVLWCSKWVGLPRGVIVKTYDKQGGETLAKLFGDSSCRKTCGVAKESIKCWLDTTWCNDIKNAIGAWRMPHLTTQKPTSLLIKINNANQD